MQYNFDRDGLVSSESPSFWTLVSGTTYGFGRIEHSLQIFTSPRKHRLLLCGLIQKQGSNICHTLVGYTYPRVEGTSCFPFRAFRSLSEPHPLPTVTFVENRRSRRAFPPFDHMFITVLTYGYLDTFRFAGTPQLRSSR
jgi:hypothetical protein